MQIKMTTTAVSALLAVLGTACPATASASVSATTKANVLNAMHGEAKAFASYMAYADAADKANEPTIAILWRSTGNTERDEHFTEEAKAIGLVGSSAANLEAIIDSDDNQAEQMYQTYSHQAIAEGNAAAARLFTELSRCLSTHGLLVRQALQAVEGQGKYPDLPVVMVIPITAGSAPSHGQTLRNLQSAMREEAFYSARYHLYAKTAADEGNVELSNLLSALSDIDRLEHFAALANLSALVGTTAQNLTRAIIGETYETATMYPDYALAAAQAGDASVAELLIEIDDDESRHRDAFHSALVTLANP